MKEWPLILFTLSVQVACGLALGATTFEMVARPSEVVAIRLLAMAIFPVVAMGILVSLAHLGRPLRAWRAMVNLRQSRLSLEVALTMVFAVLSLVYSGLWGIERSDGRLVLGIVASVAGVAAVVAGAGIYTIPTRPVWNSAWVPTSFLGTSVLLGGMAPAVLIRWHGQVGLLRLFLAATVAGSLLLLVAAMWALMDFSRCARDPMTAVRSVIVGCYVALVGIVPVAVAARLWPLEAAKITPFAGAILAAVILGTAIGRAGMFWLGARYRPF